MGKNESSEDTFSKLRLLSQKRYLALFMITIERDIISGNRLFDKTQNKMREGLSITHIGDVMRSYGLLNISSVIWDNMVGRSVYEAYRTLL